MHCRKTGLRLRLALTIQHQWHVNFFPPGVPTMMKPKQILPVLTAVLALVMLNGCPQSKLPDKPPSVPQPKASQHLPHFAFEI